jgi:cation:H+ antiporter
MGLLPPTASFLFLLFLFFAAPLKDSSASAFFWSAPAILCSSLMIAWAAEASQYFVAQGFALAILALLQTLPEFAFEAVLAWHQKTPLLLANLTGALRLLTGLGWPAIYLFAAVANRRRTGQPLRRIELEEHHAVEVVGLMIALLYIPVIAIRGSLNVWDGIVLIAIYVAYLLILGRLPSEDHESVEDLDRIPRAIVLARRPMRILAIAILFLLGGALIYLNTETFAASLIAVAALAGIPQFVLFQWVAPLVSEFPEMFTTLYWAVRPGRGSMSLMNMVSSNVNQWTLLPALLPVVYSISLGTITPINFDAKQELELWLTLGQATLGVIFLLNMELAWWEAVVLGVLFAVPFADAKLGQPVTYIYFAWSAVEVVRAFLGHRKMTAFPLFAQVWTTYIRKTI